MVVVKLLGVVSGGVGVKNLHHSGLVAQVTGEVKGPRQADKVGGRNHNGVSVRGVLRGPNGDGVIDDGVGSTATH